MIALIVACDEKNTIGLQGNMPWHIPRDLKYFRQQTLHQTVIMGHQTYQSLGKALPQRNNMVLSRQNIQLNDAIVVHDAQQALDLAQSFQKDIWIIGGAQIYQLFMPFIQKIYLTRIHHAFHGDTFFHWDHHEWFLCEKTHHASDEQSAYDLSFYIYQRHDLK